jgi:cytochrome c-type biogenesis protein CcmF
MLAAHAGIGVFVAGVTMAKGFDASHDASLKVGDSATLDGYTFTLTALRDVTGPNYTGVRGLFDVTRDGEWVAAMAPEKRLYAVQNMAMTEAAIDRGPLRDLYVSLGEQTSPGRWLVRVQVKPFIGWIWAGALLIAAGGFTAAADRRYRARAAAAVRTPAAMSTTAVTP